MAKKAKAARGERGAGGDMVLATCFEVTYNRPDGEGGLVEESFLTKSASGIDKKIRAHAGGPVPNLAFACVQKTYAMPLAEFAATASDLGEPGSEPELVEDVS